MRILFLTETTPYPLDSGGRVKTFNTLRILSRQHEIHCHVCLPGSLPEAAPPALQALCASLTLHPVARGVVHETSAFLRSVASRQPFTISRYADAAMDAAIRTEIESNRYQLVYADHLSMMGYVHGGRPPVLYDAHNAEFEVVRRYARHASAGPVRWVAEREWKLLRGFERDASARAALTLVTSQADAEALTLAGTRMRILPISFDVRNTIPMPAPNRSLDILHLGGLHWPPNRDALEFFAREVFPLICAERPDARLLVVGRSTPSQRRTMKGWPGVEALGSVDDLDPIWKRARVLVVPLRSGSGMRVKILEAFARGVPVVSTSVGCEGIEAVPGRELLVADDPAGLARETLRVMADDGLASALAGAARTLACERYDLEVVAAGLLDAVETASRAT